MSTQDLTRLGLCEIAEAVSRGELSALEVSKAYFERAVDLNPKLGAFIFLDESIILKQAEEIDLKRNRGETLGALAGVPIAIKDSICTKDQPTTCGSKILVRDGKGWESPYDATVVARLRAADAVIFGKTNLDEFAMGSSTENSALQVTRNPWALDRVPGGSSGGSAVAVAARMVAGALGSDTGGSIRQPASLTHTVGLKPSYGRVSRFGLVAFASSLDQVGPITTDARGASRVFQVISGYDPRDATSSALAVADTDRACGGPIAGLKIGIPEEYFGEGLDAGVKQRVQEALEALVKAGCELRPVHLPHTKYAIATYYVIATAEASSNLARFDGVRFGMRVSPERGDVSTMYSLTRGAGFGPEVKRRIMLGTYVLSAGYYEAYYLKAQKLRTLMRRDFIEAFKEVDLIATPTSPIPAWCLGEKLSDPLSMYLADIFTLPASLAGVPAISVPCRPIEASEGKAALPVGLQLIAPAYREESLFRVASEWERLNPEAARIPPC